jgi:hypothetical protein
MSRINSCGELLAHGGKATSPTDVPLLRGAQVEAARVGEKLGEGVKLGDELLDVGGGFEAGAPAPVHGAE